MEGPRENASSTDEAWLSSDAYVASMKAPSDPIAAATHPDPYPYYASLVSEKPFSRDESLGSWVAASAEAVTEVLRSPALHVRPRGERVPRALAGTEAGDVFGRLVRMNDGEAHTALRREAESVLRALDAVSVAAAARERAATLAAELEPFDDPRRVTELAFRLPVEVLALLLGAPSESLREVSAAISDLAPAFSPGGSSAHRPAADAAVRFLAPLLSGARGGCASAIGFLFQSFDATAGLIGATLVALGRHGDVRKRVEEEPSLLRCAVLETLRHDPPVQNTRRFVAEPCRVSACDLEPGETVLVLLAAANRDPRANPRPELFELERRDRVSFTFGLGAHACPGEAIAATIAEAAVATLLAGGLDPVALSNDFSYRASMNVRIPIFRRRPGAS
jgi:cytochrome P450